MPLSCKGKPDADNKHIKNSREIISLGTQQQSKIYKTFVVHFLSSSWKREISRVIITCDLYHTMHLLELLQAMYNPNIIFK